MEPRGIHRRTDIEVTDSLKARFWNRVKQGEPGECWPWLGSMRNGYGAIKHQGKVLGTHCVAYTVTHGPIESGHLVCHTCDNRLCCNPAHLYLGTPSDNARDMFDRRGIDQPRGEEMYNAILNEDIVREIRRRREETGWGATRLAREFPYNVNTIKGVIHRETWKHVE